MVTGEGTKDRVAFAVVKDGLCAEMFNVYSYPTMLLFNVRPVMYMYCATAILMAVAIVSWL